jgi:hypothetical protein
MKRDPTPLNDRYNVMPKYKDFRPGVRHADEEPPKHGTVKVLFNRDFPGVEGSYYCSACRAAFREPKHASCPRCLEPFNPPK